MLGRNTLRFAVGEVGSRLPLLVLELSLARALGPAVYGIWSIVQTFITYGNFLHFGVSSSLARLEPGLIEMARLTELRANRAATYGFQLLVVVVVMLVYTIVGTLIPSIAERFGGLGLGLTLMSVVLVQQITITVQSSALNEYRFMSSSIARLVFAFCFLGLGLVSARAEAPILWLTLSWSAALTTALGVLSVLAPGLLVRPVLDLRRTLMLLADGFPIMLQGLMRFGLMSMDKLAVFALGTSVAVGYYGLGSLGASLTGLFGAMVARVSLPTLLRLRTRSGARAQMQREFDHMMVLIQVLTLGLVFSICAFGPLFVHFMLPLYEPAIWTIGVLAIVGGFIGLGQAMNDVTMSLGVKASVLVNTVVTLVLEALMIALAWFAVGTIESVAFAVLGAMLYFAGRSTYLGMTAVGFTAQEARRKLVVLALRAALAVLACLVALGLQELAFRSLPTSPLPLIGLNVILLPTLVIGMWFLLRVLRNRGNSEEGGADDSV